MSCESEITELDAWWKQECIENPNDKRKFIAIVNTIENMLKRKIYYRRG